MAFPWTFSENFDLATRGNFDATSGTLIDFPHFSELARAGMAPYRGAYCLRVRPAAGTTSQFVREDTGFDLAATNTLFFRWMFYLGRDLVMATNDKFSFVELESTLDTTTEAAAGILWDGTNYKFWMNETQAAASPSTVTLGTPAQVLGRWIHAEIKVLIDSGVGNDGTIDGWIDDVAMTQVTALDQAAIVDAKFGVIGPDAGTSGTILIDQIIADDTQVFRPKERFGVTNYYVYDAQDHPIIGPGEFEIALTGTGTNAVATLYDTNGVPTNLAPIDVLRNTVANETIPGVKRYRVNHGLYLTLSGTGAQAFIQVHKARIMSNASLIRWGQSQGRPTP